MKAHALIGAALLMVASQSATANQCERTEVTLITSSQPANKEVGDPHNIFDGPDDHAIYYSASDWLSDPDAGEYLDGLVEFNFGMNFGNAGTQPEGFDKQVKFLQEYKLSPAYARGFTETSLQSATLRFIVDDVLDMTHSGQTDLWAPSEMYLNVFAGDGLLTTLADAQIDFDRCEASKPQTWEMTVPLLTDEGYRICDDEVDAAGGQIVFNIDVTDLVRPHLAAGDAFLGITAAGSSDGDTVLMSMDGGLGTFAQFPRLILVGPFLGDFDESETIDLYDFAVFQECFAADVSTTTNGCAIADLDYDLDVDNDDLLVLQPKLMGPTDLCIDPLMGQTSLELPAINEPQNGVAPRFFGDFNDDGEFDIADHNFFWECQVEQNGTPSSACMTADLNHDGRLDEGDQKLYKQIFPVE